MCSSTLLDAPGVAHAININARRALPALRRFGLEAEDAQQEFCLALLEAEGKYDPQRSSQVTYCTAICKFRKLQILEKTAAAKRNGVSISLSPAGDEGDELTVAES